jgi:hypothetical protein
LPERDMRMSETTEERISRVRTELLKTMASGQLQNVQVILVNGASITGQLAGSKTGEGENSVTLRTSSGLERVDMADIASISQGMLN